MTPTGSEESPGLALSLKLPAPGQVRVQGVTAQTLSAGAVLTAQVRQWLSVEAWSASSIKHGRRSAGPSRIAARGAARPRGSAHGGDHAVACALATDVVGARLACCARGTFLAAWFVARCAVAVESRPTSARDLDQYAGKTWREKHIASDDGPLFAFIEKVRATLPPPPAAHLHFLPTRTTCAIAARITSTRHNVYFDPSVNTTVPRRGCARRLRGRLPTPGGAIRPCAAAPSLGRQRTGQPPTCCSRTPGCVVRIR
jgi:hypothetical protein